MRDAKDTLSKSGGSGDEADTGSSYDRTVKAIEVMPEHVHLFIEASPDEAPSMIARTLKSISAVHIFTAFPKLKERKFEGAQVLGIRTVVSRMLLRKCRCNHRGKREKVHREPEVKHRRYRVMSKRRVAGLIAIAAIVLFIVADMLFSLDLPRQNFFTYLIAFVCILFIGWCFLSKPGK